MHRRMSSVRIWTILLSVPLTVATGLTVPAWALPLPASNLQLTTRDGYVYADWTPSPSTTSANVCIQPDVAPSSPNDAGATCSGIVTDQAGWTFAVGDGVAVGVSVFSYDIAAGEYGTALSGTIVARDLPPEPPMNLRSDPESAIEANELPITWDDNPANTDTREFVVSWSPGLATPGVTPDGTEHIADSPGMYWIGSAAANIMYTIAVRVRDMGGHLSDPAVLHAGLRRPGLWLSDNNRAGHVLKAVISTGDFLPESGGPAVRKASGEMAGAYLSDGGYLEVTFHSANGKWMNPFPSNSSNKRYSTQPPLLASAPGSGVAVAWSNPSGVFIATVTPTKWTSIRRLPSIRGERVVGLAVDSARGVHVLIRRTKAPAGGLYYVGESGTHTYRSKVSGTGGSDVGLLARDPVTDRIIVVMRHRTARAETLRVKVVDPAATRVGPLTSWLTSTRRSVDWTPTQAAANHGRITIGLQRASVGPTRPGDGPYVISGAATYHHAPVRVTGTSAADTNLTVSAPTATKVMLSWQRRSPNWNPKTTGIWQATRLYRPGHGWTFTAPRRWTASAYDVPAGAFADLSGHIYLMYVRLASDLKIWSPS